MTNDEVQAMVERLMRDGVRIPIPCPDGLKGCLVAHYRIEPYPVNQEAAAMLTALSAEVERLKAPTASYIEAVSREHDRHISEINTLRAERYEALAEVKRLTAANAMLFSQTTIADDQWDAKCAEAERWKRRAESLQAQVLHPCRHTRSAEQESDRPDLHDWQTAQSEWFTADILEIVSEYAAWRDGQEATSRSEMAETTGAWVFPKSIDDMPPKPGLADYEYVECLVLHKGSLLARPWNCEHKVFDDEEQDDHFCEWNEIAAYRVIGHERAIIAQHKDTSR